MENSNNSKVSSYLEYFATICLVLSDDIKNHEIGEEFNLIKQNLDELSNSMSIIVDIVNKDDKVYSGITDGKQIIRDFKIRKIINE